MQIKVGAATKKAIARSVRRSEIEEEGANLVKLIEADIRDWFTLSPSYRTKERLIQMIRVSCGKR